jgi:hypothetical protein
MSRWLQGYLKFYENFKGGRMGSIEKYKEEQKALVVYYQSGASFIEKKTEKMGIASTNISGKMCIPFTKK